MKRPGIIVLLGLLSFAGAHAQTNSFQASFDALLACEEAFRLDPDAIAEWGFDPGLIATNQMKTAIAAMSNCVEEASAMIPSVLTNDLSREVFLTMAGHAGTNAFFRVWDGLLAIAETNGVAVSPETVHSFCLAATTPLDCYVVFFHDEPSVHSLLERTRDLFPTNSEKRTWCDRTLSGVEEGDLRTYLMDSGAGLPWFAR